MSITLPRRFCGCARGYAKANGHVVVPDTDCRLCDESGRSLSPVTDALLDTVHTFNVKHPLGANRVVMHRRVYEALRQESGARYLYAPEDRLTCIFGMRIDIDADTTLPVVSRVEAP